MHLLRTTPIGAPLSFTAPAVTPADGHSTDRSWTSAGDENGFHPLVPDAADEHERRTAATPGEPGSEIDRWIGNVRVTGSGGGAVVVCAPGTFTNHEALFDPGGSTAVVDLTCGAVRELRVRTSLACFDPGRVPDEDPALSQATGSGAGAARRLHLGDAGRGRADQPGRDERPGWAGVRHGAGLFGPRGRQLPFILAGDTKTHSPPVTPDLGPPAFHGGEEPDCGFAGRWPLTVPVTGSRVDEDVGSLDGDPCSDHLPVHAEIRVPDL